MELNLNQSILNNDISANTLVAFLRDNADDFDIRDSILYHNFPIYRDEYNKDAIVNILFLSKLHGLYIFKCIDQTRRTLDESNIKMIVDELEQIHSLVFSKLVKIKKIRKSLTELKIPIYLCIFSLSALPDSCKFTEILSDLTIICNRQNLASMFGKKLPEPLSDDIINETTASIEGSRTIIKPKERPVSGKLLQTKGRILEKVESEIALFDREQKRAAMFTLDGPQRIRGLAGSGKTIILAMKAALIHLQHQEAEILYTFWTKSLYSLTKELITKFYRQFSDKDPTWEKIHIMHAWGGENIPGVYFSIARNNNIRPMKFGEVRGQKDAFDKICRDLEKHNLKKSFDYSILDEAQDFPMYFYRLCRKVTQNNRIIWGYDECQNILDIDIQDTKSTFGKDKDGDYHIDFSNLPADSLQDLVLHKCYRNPRRSLLTAFALGFGIYNSRIIQMLENNDHWEDLGFEVFSGNSNMGDDMIISRPEQNSPLIKNELLESNNAIKVEVFKNMEDEIKYVVQQILNDLNDDLRPDDIMVISLDDIYARKYFQKIELLLGRKKIDSFNILNAPSTNTDFAKEGCVTLTTVYRAKGNEAGSVYILGVDFVFNNSNKDNIQQRNKMFTAITRSNAWVTITGIGDNALLCKKEVDETLAKYPNLEFKMPDRQSLKIFQRDLDMGQAALNKVERELDKISSEHGISKEDLLKQLEERYKKKK